MSSKAPVKFILGTHIVGDSTKDPTVGFDSVKDVAALLGAFHRRGYNEIDEARNCSPHAPGSSEVRLGQAGAASRFTIHLKVRSLQHGDHEPSKIDLSIEETLDALETSAVETIFVHVPDRRTPFEDTAGVMTNAIQRGKFKRFGFSNYTSAKVKQFIEICEQKGYTKPSVYEGHCNANCERGRKGIIPTLA